MTLREYKIYKILNGEIDRSVAYCTPAKTPAEALVNYLKGTKGRGHFRLAYVDSSYAYADFIVVEVRGDKPVHDTHFQVRQIMDDLTFAFEDWTKQVLPNRRIT